MASERIIRRLWSVYSRVYDGLLDLGPYVELIERTVKALDVRSGQVVVELGCGTGNVAAAIVSDQPTVELVAVDSSPEMLAVAGPKLGDDAQVSLALADLNDWLSRAPSGSVDRLVTMNVLYAFDDASRRTFWVESLRVLAPGGRMIVVTSDRPGIGPVVREQWRSRHSLRRVLTPRLAAVGIVNLVIWLFEADGVFHPEPVERLRQECEDAGGAVLSSVRCYGGERDGVDVLMVVEPVVDLRRTEARQAAPEATGNSDGEPEVVERTDL